VSVLTVHRFVFLFSFPGEQGFEPARPQGGDHGEASKELVPGALLAYGLRVKGFRGLGSGSRVNPNPTSQELVPGARLAYGEDTDLCMDTGLYR